MCFSKRRNGVFTKATDLATLCGAQVAVVVNSPAHNPYSFGSPGVNEVVDRFLSGNLVPSSSSILHQTHQANLIRELNLQCMELSRRMEMANARKAFLEARLKGLAEMNLICKLVEEIEGLAVSQLKVVEASLKWVREKVEGRIRELVRGAAAGAAAAASSSSASTFAAVGTGQAYWGANIGYGRGFY